MDLPTIYSAVKDTENRVIELIEKQAEHNEILRTHEARSLALQAAQERLGQRMEPVEKHVAWVSSFLKVGGIVIAGVLIQALAKWLLH